MADREIEVLDEEQCLDLISAGGIGRIAYSSRYGPTVLPVNYSLRNGAIVFRTAENGPLDDDLRTGIADADTHVAFEIDSIDQGTRQGWSVLIQGPAHHLDDAEREAVRDSGIQSWAPGDRELFLRIVPSRITGRRLQGV
jgi:nitroimidazol reductase NimA-like FMN-containing flavoprotein (pyridoxamine 5'-phosphate oxidase superfamily)